MNATFPEVRAPEGCRVLIVEDHPDGRNALRALLELLGYEVVLAEEGEAGVAQGLRHRPHVALIDIGLPRLNGYDVARRLRAALGDCVFLIAHTAYGRPEDREEALAAGFDAHLVKPAVFCELTACLRRAAVRRADTADAPQDHPAGRAPVRS